MKRNASFLRDSKKVRKSCCAFDVLQKFTSQEVLHHHFFVSLTLLDKQKSSQLSCQITRLANQKRIAR